MISALVAASSVVVATNFRSGWRGVPRPGRHRRVNDSFPSRLSSLVGADIRTGGHECFERVVVEFSGTGELPGYQVQYEPDPILDSPRVSRSMSPATRPS